MPLRCFCGGLFTSIELLRNHADAYGHRFLCSCGSLFRTREDVHTHQQSVHHLAPVTETENPTLVDIAPTIVLTVTQPAHCTICHRRFVNANAVRHHTQDKHPACPTCNQVFDSVPQRFNHQKAAGHCYCHQHNLAFHSNLALREHDRAAMHDNFECIDCHRSYRTRRALDDHFAACTAAPRVIDGGARAAATAAAVEEANLRCKQCRRDFTTITAFRQHKQSVKHKPLSKLRCPLSEQCKATFTSPSALVLHLESGGCKSGMTRQSLNQLVYAHDTDLRITDANHARLMGVGNPASLRQSAPSSYAVSNIDSDFDRLSISSREDGVILTPGGSDSEGSASCEDNVLLTPDESGTASTTTSRSGVVLTPSVSSTSTIGGGVIFTPSTSSVRSRSSTASGVVITRSATSSRQAIREWQFLNNSSQHLTPATTSIDGNSVDTLTYDSRNNNWPCTKCARTFRKKEHLLQHLDSAAHAPKVFHCPTGLVGLSGSGSRHRNLTFKTLSGLSQHIEAGACAGGMQTLKTIVSMFEREIETRMGTTVRLLRDSD